MPNAEALQEQSWLPSTTSDVSVLPLSLMSAYLFQKDLYSMSKSFEIQNLKMRKAYGAEILHILKLVVGRRKKNVSVPDSLRTILSLNTNKGPDYTSCVLAF